MAPHTIPKSKQSLQQPNTTLQPRNKTPTPTSAPTFKPFSNFPLEIRLKIYQLIDLHHPKDVLVKINSSVSTYNRHSRITTLTPVPKILHINHESRTEGLKKYTTLFSIRKQQSRGIFINFEVQTLFILLREHCHWTMVTSRINYLFSDDIDAEKNVPWDEGKINVVGEKVFYPGILDQNWILMLRNLGENEGTEEGKEVKKLEPLEMARRSGFKGVEDWQGGVADEFREVVRWNEVW